MPGESKPGNLVRELAIPGGRAGGGYYIILYQGWQDRQTAYVCGKTPIACGGAGFPLARALGGIANPQAPQAPSRLRPISASSYCKL